MKPLIEIRSIPISIEYKVNNARIERNDMLAQVEVSRNKGGLTMKSRPITLNIDSFEAKNSVVQTPRRSVEENAQRGKNIAYEATARFAQEGQMLLDIHLDNNALGEIAMQRMESSENEFGIGFIPSAPADISWTPGELSIQYQMDKMNFDWKTQRADVKFIPGNIEFQIKEYNRVVIEYIGGPIYVPASADPNYVPIDTRA